MGLNKQIAEAIKKQFIVGHVQAKGTVDEMRKEFICYSAHKLGGRFSFGPWRRLGYLKKWKCYSTSPD